MLLNIIIFNCEITLCFIKKYKFNYILFYINFLYITFYINIKTLYIKCFIYIFIYIKFCVIYYIELISLLLE